MLINDWPFVYLTIKVGSNICTLEIEKMKMWLSKANGDEVPMCTWIIKNREASLFIEQLKSSGENPKCSG